MRKAITIFFVPSILASLIAPATAADAVIVEPEPESYVQVCDTYGTGFFYIPGTESCISINGYLRTTYGSGKLNRDIEIGTVAPAPRTIVGDAGPTTVNYLTQTQLLDLETDSGFHNWDYRSRLNIDVRNETEWGTLQSLLRLQAGDTNQQDGALGVDQALISIAGFRLGYTNAFLTTNHKDGFFNARSDGYYDFDQAILFDYTWAVDGLSLTIGVQDSESGGANFSNSGGYADFYAGVRYKAEWGEFAISALHDSRAITDEDYLLSESDPEWDDDRGAWVIKSSVDVDLSTFLDGAAIRGWFTHASSPYSNYVKGGGALINTAFGSPYLNGQSFAADFNWGVSVKMELTNNLIAYSGYALAHLDTALDLVTVGNRFNVVEKHQIATAGLVWKPISGLALQTEFNWENKDHRSSLNGADFLDVQEDRQSLIFRATRSW